MELHHLSALALIWLGCCFSSEVATEAVLPGSFPSIATPSTFSSYNSPRITTHLPTSHTPKNLDAAPQCWIRKYVKATVPCHTLKGNEWCFKAEL